MDLKVGDMVMISNGFMGRVFEVKDGAAMFVSRGRAIGHAECGKR